MSTDKGSDDYQHVSTVGSSEKNSRSTQGAGQILNELSRRNAVSKTGSKRRGGGMAGLLIVIVTLPLIAAVLFLAWQQTLLQATVAGLQQQNRRLATELASQSDTLAELRQEMNTPVTIDTGELQEADAALRQVDSDLAAELESLRQELARLESRQQVDNATTIDPELARVFADLLHELEALDEATEVIEQ